MLGIVRKLWVAFYKSTHCGDCHRLILSPAIWVYFMAFWVVLRKGKVLVCPKCVESRRLAITLMPMALGLPLSLREAQKVEVPIPPPS